jgi:hypothetical protein
LGEQLAISATSWLPLFPCEGSEDLKLGPRPADFPPQWSFYDTQIPMNKMGNDLHEVTYGPQPHPYWPGTSNGVKKKNIHT